MRKTFPLEIPGLKPARVIEGIKRDVRRYLKRERRKTLPEEVDFWDFNCAAGLNQESAKSVHVAELTTAIDLAAKEAWPTIYLEILAKPGLRGRNESAQEPTNEEQ